MKAIIWAAGLGTRLRPLTEHLPKCMVPVGAEPMIVHAIRQCKAAGIEEIMINLHYFPAVVSEYLGNGEQYGVQLSYKIEEHLLENAGAVVNVRDFFGQEPFLAFASDNLTDIDLTAMQTHHRAKGGLVTIATTLADDVTKYGIVSCDQNSRILSFQEKPEVSEAKGDQVATCIYLFEPDIFEHLPKTPQKCHFGKEVFPALLEQNVPVFAYQSGAYWNDIGNPDSYLQANFDVLSGQAHLAIPYDEPSPHVHVGAQTYIAPSATIVPPVIIGNHCHIASHSVIGPFAAIGNHSTIEEGSMVDNTVLFENSRIGAGSLVWGSILGRHTSIYPQNQIKNLVLGENSLVNKTTTSRQESMAKKA